MNIYFQNMTKLKDSTGSRGNKHTEVINHLYFYKFIVIVTLKCGV